jgi:hypothetical protein
MSHAALVSCIQVPTFEAHDASQRARKTGWTSGCHGESAGRRTVTRAGSGRGYGLASARSAVIGRDGDQRSGVREAYHLLDRRFVVGQPLDG